MSDGSGGDGISLTCVLERRGCKKGVKHVRTSCHCQSMLVVEYESLTSTESNAGYDQERSAGGEKELVEVLVQGGRQTVVAMDGTEEVNERRKRRGRGENVDRGRRTNEGSSGTAEGKKVKKKNGSSNVRRMLKRRASSPALSTLFAGLGGGGGSGRGSKDLSAGPWPGNPVSPIGLINILGPRLEQLERMERERERRWRVDTESQESSGKRRDGDDDDGHHKHHPMLMLPLSLSNSLSSLLPLPIRYHHTTPSNVHSHCPVNVHFVTVLHSLPIS